MYFGLIKIDKSEPKIIKLETPIKMIGVSMKTSMNTIYKDAAILGKEYEKIKNQNLVQNKKTPWAFVAVSKNFSNDNNSWEYLMGDVVTSFDNVPKGLIAFEIPARTYAVFTIRPKFSFLWGPTIGLTKKYIFTEWLPNSKYESDSNILGDFEFHDDRSISRNPSIDLYVTVKEKKH
jgi:predicted transcriptional regulator YdeE